VKIHSDRILRFLNAWPAFDELCQVLRAAEMIADMCSRYFSSARQLERALGKSVRSTAPFPRATAIGGVDSPPSGAQRHEAVARFNVAAVPLTGGHQ
jgi:hypothetical protein